MKTTCWLLLLSVLGVGAAQGQTASTFNPAANRPGGAAQDTPYAVVERGANHRTWQRTTYERLPDGRQVPHLQQYIELASGLHYRNARGEWVEAKEEFEVKPGKAIARQGQHKVTLHHNLNSAGAIELETPDGQLLKSHVLGLSYFDAATGQSVLLAEVKDCTGEVLGNQVIYADAFTDFRADVRYTYTKAGFEQDIILREQPPRPEEYGLNPETTRLQVLTEFVQAPEPGKHAGGQVRHNGQELRDETLSFGSMYMGRGKAFSLGREDRDIPMGKQWLKLEGRDVLVEEAAVPDLEEELQALPAAAESAAIERTTGSSRHTVSTRRLLPSPKLARSGTNEMRLAQALPAAGLVLDYTTLNAGIQTNFTFQGDLTYYISGSLNLFGTSTFEGGAVIKYASGASLAVVPAMFTPNIVFQTSPYRPVLFTAKDDNTVGQVIDGSSGNPSGYYASPALNIVLVSGSSPTLSNFRISYAKQAVQLAGSILPRLSHGQLVNCQNGFTVGGANAISLRNLLFSGVQTNFNQLQYATFDVENATFATSSNLISIRDTPYQSVYMRFTNCVFANVARLTNNYSSSPLTFQLLGDRNGFFNTPLFGANPLSTVFYPFQTVGAGSYYLATNCVFRNLGTTNVDAGLLTALSQKTTYPPIVYANTAISAATTFFPQAQRDNDVPDLGYHYDPLDYVFSGVEARSNLTFTAGTAVGWYDNQSGAGYGIKVNKGATVAFNGTAEEPCWMARYDTVQEGNGNWKTTGWLAGITSNSSSPGYTPDGAQVVAQFTKFSSRNFNDSAFRDYTGFLIIRANHCEFWTAGCGGYAVSLNYTNCLFFRSPPSAVCTVTSVSFTMRNCTVIGGNFNPLTTVRQNGALWPVVITDCAFDGTSFNMDNPNPNYTYCDYNAFLTNAAHTSVMGGHELTTLTNFNWRSGRLGNYYLPADSLLRDQGSRTADQVGLFHFTTQTNGVREGFSTVDIGYHYVAHTIETVWVEDAVPAGASEYGDSWSWISANPAPFSGELALQSDINPGYSSYFFYGASDVLVVNTDDTLVAYVFLDPENTPAEIGLWWYGGGELERRTWWAASGSGTSYMGPLPPAGQWMRLEVPASQIGLEGTVMSALTFYVVGGRATWDYVGKADRFSPVDSNGDGILDYLEDANGNGLVDSGEIAWNIPGDLGLKVIITRPRNGSTLP